VPVVLARQCLDGPCSHEGLQTRHRHRFCCAMPADSPPPTSCYQDPQAFATLVAFSGCAASLLLVNKVIMHQAHMPSFVGTLQFAASSFVAMLVMLQGWAKPDKFTWRRVKPYILYVTIFVAAIYTNFKALEFANVETIIVARSCVPCVVALMDFACLGRQLPGWKSWLAMVFMAAGATGYVLTDKQFEENGASDLLNSTLLNSTLPNASAMSQTSQGGSSLDSSFFQAYCWVLAYFLVVSVEMAYGKYIVGPHLGFESMWGPVLYNNTLSIPPMLTIGLLSGEHHLLCEVEWTGGLVALVLLSCAIGVAISYYGFKARSLVSATCFTVLGVANKMITVVANLLVWDQHATPLGICFLFLTLLSASAYKQSPMRQQQKALIQGEEKLSEQSMQPITESLDPATEQEPDAAKCGLRQA